jgi:hypothetical protein
MSTELDIRFPAARELDSMWRWQMLGCGCAITSITVSLLGIVGEMRVLQLVGGALLLALLACLQQAQRALKRHHAAMDALMADNLAQLEHGMRD